MNSTLCKEEQRGAGVQVERVQERHLRRDCRINMRRRGECEGVLEGGRDGRRGLKGVEVRAEEGTHGKGTIFFSKSFGV